METARSENTLGVDAPYGYLKDGVTPKKGPGGRPSKGGTNRRNNRPGNSGPSTATAPPAPPRRSGPKPRSGVDYRPGLVGLFHVGAAPLLAQRRSVALQLDGMALLMIGHEMAEGFNHLAQLRPEVAAAAEKLIAVGPYGAIVAPFLKFGAQVAENHGWAPTQVTRALGAVSREEMEATIVQQARAAQQAQQDAAAYVAESAGTPDPGPAETAEDPMPAESPDAGRFPDRIDLSQVGYADPVG